MLTEKQRKEYITALKSFKRKYLVKKHMGLDESATRLMINSFLTSVLGYEELDEIKTEYAIKGTYADYVIQLEKKQHIVIEVKAIQIDINDNHIRQAVNYAANEGIDWVLLTNGRQWQLYRVIFEKPLRNQQVFNFNMTELDEFKKAQECFEFLTKKCVANGDLEKFWNRFISVEPANMSKHFYNYETVKLMKKLLKREVGINFSDDEVFDAIHQIITTPIEGDKPRMKKPRAKVKG